MVTYYASARRLELEFQRADPIEGPMIPRIIADPEAFAAVDRAIREELAMGKVLSADGRRLFMDPKYDLQFQKAGGEIVRVNSTSEYIWCDRACYVIDDRTVITAIHVTEKQIQTLMQIERVSPADVAYMVSLRSRLPAEFQVARNSNESGMHAKVLPVGKLRQDFPAMPSPTWLFQENAMLTLVVTDVWKRDGQRVIKPLKRKLIDMALQDRDSGLVRSMLLRESDAIAEDRIHGLIRKTFGPTIRLPPLPLSSLRSDMDAFMAQMDVWWEAMRSVYDDRRIYLLVTPNEARNLCESILGTVQLRSCEVKSMLRLVYDPSEVHPFDPGRIIDIEFANQWLHGGRPVVRFDKC
jgi:hypothetical protein